MTRRVLVCGGRDYGDYWTVVEVLDGMHRADPIDCIIQGGALGADRFAREWAVRNRISYEQYVADWEKHGRAAGPIRNQFMLDEGRPDIVVAFPGGKGTANMIDTARRCNVPVSVIEDQRA